jgi:hypothetical protein
MYDFGARLYNPCTGRFFSADTSTADGFNRYTFVSNNPLRHRDPSGHQQLCRVEEGGCDEPKDPKVKKQAVAIAAGGLGVAVAAATAPAWGPVVAGAAGTARIVGTGALIKLGQWANGVSGGASAAEGSQEFIGEGATARVYADRAAGVAIKVFKREIVWRNPATGVVLRSEPLTDEYIQENIDTSIRVINQLRETHPNLVPELYVQTAAGEIRMTLMQGKAPSSQMFPLNIFNRWQAQNIIRDVMRLRPELDLDSNPDNMLFKGIRSTGWPDPASTIEVPWLPWNKQTWK